MKYLNLLALALVALIALPEVGESACGGRGGRGGFFHRIVHRERHVGMSYAKMPRGSCAFGNCR